MSGSGPAWARAAGDGVHLTLRVQPRASKTEVVGPQGDALKVRVASPPVDGAANREIVAFLSKLLRRPRSAITISGGERGRLKSVSVNDMTVSDVIAALTPDRP